MARAFARSASPSSPTPPPVRREARCLHCRTPISYGTTAADEFCCRGCEAVYALLHRQGLARYYELGGGEGHPVALGAEANDAGTEPPTGADHKWLEPIADGLSRAKGVSRIVLDVQGVHCSACVWLFDELFRRRSDACGILVNPGIGSVALTVGPEFALDAFVRDVEAFGYRFGPARKTINAASSDLVWRMGVCIAIAMNTMIFGFALYCGLSEGPVYRLFHALDFGLSFLSVAIGGTVFFRSAWQALKQRVLHLDLPIALGIALAFASSTYTYFVRGGESSYFDTINVFIALMLVGRFLQERVLAKNRAYLLQDHGIEGLFTRRIDAEGRVGLVRCTELRAGDRLLLGRGDLVPVDAELDADASAVFSLDWINGESAPRTFGRDETIVAGAFSHGAKSITVRAKTDFDASAIVSLLATSHRRDADVARATPWWKRFTSVYVALVLAIATFGAAGWLLVSHDTGRTLDVVAAVLIVTCPCAFGIATPLAYELAQARLRREGLFVRTPGFLDRATSLKRVVFDKTGTLTTGSLTLARPEALTELAASDRSILANLALRSLHPKSRAIAAALARLGEVRVDPALDVREIDGKGLELVVGSPGNMHLFRLGAPAWAAAPAKVAPLDLARSDVLFTCDGDVLAAMKTCEELRGDVRTEVAALKREGYEPFILSGDSPEATRRMADACGIPEAQAFGAKSPEGKAAWLRRLGSEDTLFVGDGINDSLVAEEASCAGTPAIDRPFMAARCDFYFVTPGLRPVRAALAMSKRLASVVRTNLAIAVFYNAITVSLALAGLMTPLVCAVLMPVSSLSTVLATTFRMLRRSDLAPIDTGGKSAWKS